MVDLMMWLVIAALLLATAIQSIGYYQKAAYVNVLKSDLAGAGSNIMAAAANGNGTVDVASVQTGSADSKWSEGVVHRVEVSSNDETPYLRVSHPTVDKLDGIYLFEPCGSLGAGVHMVPKTGSVDLAECGMSASTAGVDIHSAGVTWTEHTNLGNSVWYGMASSADGKILLAGGDTSGYLRISTNGGDTWTTRKDLGSGRWRSIDISLDGKTIIASNIYVGIWISTDSGKNWQMKSELGKEHQSVHAWHAVTVSDDGTKMATIDGHNGYLYTSSDSGATWVKRDSLGTAKRYGLATSGDGKHMVTAEYLGDVYVSNDYGATWQQKVGSGPGGWYYFSSSADGQKLAASDRNASLWISHDAGETWTQVLTSELNFYAISSSSDGNKLVAGQWNTSTGGYLWTSTDAGLTWNKNTELGAAGWRGGVVSPDGTKLLAGQFGGGFLYSGTF